MQLTIVIEIASWILFLLSKLLYLSCKKEIVGREKIEKIENSNSPFVYAFWHGRLFPMSFLYSKKKKVYAIISNHKDGELIARTVSKFGVNAVRGSTNRMPDKNKTFKNRGGSFVIRESLRILEESGVIAITPDGPRGPARKVKKNLFKPVLDKNIPVIIAGFSASKSICFSSWDNFMLPLPFSKITIFIELIENPLNKFGENGLNEFSLEIEKTLDRVTEKADKNVY